MVAMSIQGQNWTKTTAFYFAAKAPHPPDTCVLGPFLFPKGRGKLVAFNWSSRIKRQNLVIAQGLQDDFRAHPID